MENESNDNNEHLNDSEGNVFELEYANQSIKDNIKYENWEKRM